MVVSPTHARGGTLDLLMTDVPDLVLVSVVAPIGNSDHSSLSAVISMVQAVQNFVFKDKPWLDDQWRPAFSLKQEAHLRWTRDHAQFNWEEFVLWQL